MLIFGRSLAQSVSRLILGQSNALIDNGAAILHSSKETDAVAQWFNTELNDTVENTF